MELETGDNIMCTVDRIIGTIVFVKIDGTNKEGSITFSEISPGRIRNIRDFVIPKKKIICKVLKLSGDHIGLSLRRVTPKEQKEVREQYQQEQSYRNILKRIIGEKGQEIIDEISKQERIYDFFEEAKQDPSKLEKLIGAESTQKVIEILKSHKQKEVAIKKEIKLTTTNPKGLTIIKKLLDREDAEIKYISAGRYTIKTVANNLKDADKKQKEIQEEIEKETKKQGIEFQIK